MNREYHRWYSPRLRRDMELLLFGHGGEPVILLPTSCGRFYQSEDMGMLGAIQDRIDAGRYVVVCVDSVDEESWYNRNAAPAERIRRHEGYETYLLEEVAPLARSRASGEHGGGLTLAGCSFGGFHTIAIGLRRPQHFQRLLSMGAAFETAGFLDGHQDLGVYFHSVFQWLPNLTDPGLLSELARLDIILVAGEHDFCRPSNERLSALLWQKGIGHRLSIWGGGIHDWPTWKEMIRVFLP